MSGDGKPSLSAPGQRVQHARWALLACSALVTVILVILLLPFRRALVTGSFDVPAKEVRDYPEYQEIAERLQIELTPFPPHAKGKAEVGIHPLTLLGYVEFVVFARLPKAPSTSALPEIEIQKATIHLRQDRLIGTLAFLAGLLFLLSLTYESQRLPWDEWGRPASQEEFWRLTSQEIERCDRICLWIWRRARFLLAGGVLAAVGGIGAFYYFVPSEVAATKLADLGPLVRAGAIVLYVESFAFLLLRQHRSAIRDFKYFNALRLRLLYFVVAAQAHLDNIGPDDEPSMARVLLAESPLSSLGSQAGQERDGSEVSLKKDGSLLDLLSKLGGRQGSGGEK